MVCWDRWAHYELVTASAHRSVVDRFQRLDSCGFHGASAAAKGSWPGAADEGRVVAEHHAARNATTAAVAAECEATIGASCPSDRTDCAAAVTDGSGWDSPQPGPYSRFLSMAAAYATAGTVVAGNASAAATVAR